MDGVAQSPKRKDGIKKKKKKEKKGRQSGGPPLSIEEFQEEVQRDDSMEHVNLLLKRHCEHCSKGCNDVAPVFTGKIKPWSRKTDRCMIYTEYTTKDSPRNTQCKEGKAMNQIMKQLKQQDQATRQRGTLHVATPRDTPSSELAHQAELDCEAEFDSEPAREPQELQEVHGATEVSSRIGGARVFMFDGDMSLGGGGEAEEQVEDRQEPSEPEMHNFVELGAEAQVEQEPSPAFSDAVEPEPEPETEPDLDSVVTVRSDFVAADEGVSASLPVATLICVPGAGVAGAAAAAGISHRVHGPGLWSTKKLLEKHGEEVATTAPYHTWAADNGVLAVTLSSNAPDAIVSALTACSGPVLLAAHSEGGAALMEVARQRASDLHFLTTERGVRVCAAALLDSVHKGPLPGGEESQQNAAEPTLLSPSTTLAFVSSSKPLGDSQPKPWVKNGLMHGCPTRSAGTTEHLLVPHAAQDAVFEFFQQQLDALDEGGHG
jgi:hypothetical protein